MKEIIGAFVFNDDGNGCLSGKWLNDNESTPYPESAKLKPLEDPKEKEEAKKKQKFEGLYTTTWIQTGSDPEHSDLEIIKINEDIYELKWYNAEGVKFNGRGMLYKDTLIGPYWK